MIACTKTGAYLENPALAALGVTLVREAVTLAQAPTRRMSALLDLEAGRRSEVHETLGYAERAASTGRMVG